ncbi:hypothetical protein ABTC25_18740, partial [Acinetobacter baumannii]
VFVIDLASRQVSKTFDLPSGPMSLTIRPDGAVAFIRCIGSGEIAVLDLKAWSLESVIKLSPGVDGMDWVP